MAKNVDILYIHPTKALTNTMYSIMPVGVFGLINLLIKNDYEVYGINVGIEKSINDSYELVSELRDIEYKILLIDLHWYEHSYGAIQVAEISKLLYPEKPVIIGGFTTTIYADEIIKKFACIDYAVKGDSEQPLLMLVNFLISRNGNLNCIPNICYRDNQEIVNKRITYHCEDIDNLDFISDDFLKNNEFIYLATPIGIKKTLKSFWLCIARGCIYNCIYCCGSNKNMLSLFGREKIHIRSMEAVANNIEKLFIRGVQVICPTHDFEMFGTNYYRGLFSQIRDKGIKPGLYLECFQIPSNGFLLDIRSTFEPNYTIIEVSPLTGDEEVRKLNGKNFSNDELFRLIDYMAENNMRLELYYSLNLPGESSETFDKTLEQMEYIIKAYPSKLLKIICKRVVIDPLAPMRETKYGVKPSLNTFIDYYDYCKSGDETYVGYFDSSTEDLSERFNRYEDFKMRVEIYKRENDLHFTII